MCVARSIGRRDQPVPAAAPERVAWPNTSYPSTRALAGQWSVEFRAPHGRVRVRLGTRNVALPEVRGGRVPLGGDPGIKLGPSGAKALVGPVVDRTAPPS